MLLPPPLYIPLETRNTTTPSLAPPFLHENPTLTPSIPPLVHMDTTPPVNISHHYPQMPPDFSLVDT